MSWFQDDEVVQAAPPASGPPPTARASSSNAGGWWDADEVVSAAPPAQKEVRSAIENRASKSRIASSDEGNHQQIGDGGNLIKPDTSPERGVFNGLSRQVGLTARHGLEGLGQAAEIVTEPVRRLVTDPVVRALGAQSQSMPAGKLAERFADTLGLPTPESAQERVVGDAARFMAGGAGIAGASGRVARAVAPVAQQTLGQVVPQASKGTLQAAAETMALNPGAQISGAASAGAASGLAREAEGDSLAQGAAGLAGGLVGGLAGGMLTRGQNVTGAARQVDDQLEQSLGRAGVDWQKLPDAVRNSLRAEAEQAMKGRTLLDGDALARLAEFRRVGATPTRGTLSLDPAQITREQNLARMGANSSDTGLHGLAKIQNENNRALIDGLNRLGADAPDDAHTTGERMMAALQRGLDVEKANVDTLYSQARDSAGRSMPMDGHAFTTQASRLLDDALLGGALPPSVEQHLNRIAKGEVPFTVDYAEQLKTAMGKLQRASNDGQTRMALGVVRQALDDTPLVGSIGPEAGKQAVSAFNRARLANRSMMKRIERVPGLSAVYEGKATPDDFVQKYVINRGAKAADTQRLADELRRIDPDALETVRGSIAQHLKTAAIGAAADETGRFSASGYNRALMALGPRKLAQFFDAEEIAQLKAVGKVAQYTTAQPAGSAVNNSNSGNVLMGRGLDLLDRLSARVPLLGLGPTVSGAARGVQQRQAQQIGQALVRQPVPLPRQLPGMTFGALMTTSTADGH
ncbi:MAG: hypothetical protein LCH89_07925 [Proteobacteria bacterium]|nr:hypothetical protein [Pseudomonadota bacterium]